MRVYRYPRWYLGLTLITAVIFDVLFIALLLIALTGLPPRPYGAPTSLVGQLVLIAFSGGGLALLAAMAVRIFRARLTVTADSVSFAVLSGTRQVDRAAVAGRLTIVRSLAKDDTLLVLTGRDPRTRLLQFPMLLAKPALRETWLGELPDQRAALERRYAESRAAGLADLLANPRLGPTPEARQARLRRARIFVRTLDVLALFAGLWLAIYPRPFSLALAANILLPLLALTAITRPGRLIRVVHAPGSPPIIWIALAVSGGALGLATANAPDVLDPLAVFGFGVLGALPILAWLLAFDPGMRRLSPLILTAPIAVLLAGGTLDLANIAADHAPPRVFAVPVLRQWTARGRGIRARETTGMLLLGPWGPRRRPQLFQPSQRLNDLVWPGVPVCVRLHPGAFGFPWYTHVYCDPGELLLAERTLLPSLRRRVAAGDMRAAARLGLDLIKGVAGPGQRQSGLALLYQAADAEEPRAFYGLGMARLRGLGVTVDAARAAAWFAKAAGTVPDAAWELGVLTEAGRGVPRDPVRARALYRQAAEAGQTEAAFRPGTMDRLGIGTAPDPARGMIWIRHAAEQGDARAMSDLGYALLTGTGEPRDPKSGLAWLRAAATMGEPHAAQTLGARLLGRTGMRAREHAYFWLRLAVMREAPSDPARPGAEQALQRAATALSAGARGRVDRQVAAWRPMPVRPPVVAVAH